MRNNLIPAALTVFGFWWLILSIGWLFSFDKDSWELAHFFSNSKITLMSLFWGMFLSTGIFISARLFAKSQIESSEYKGISVSIGPFPKNRKKTPSTARVTLWHPKTAVWVSANRGKYPDHYNFLCAVASILDAHPLHPASIEPGGHGDRTLVDHSHFVTEFMLNIAPTYEYKGLREPGSTSVKSIDPLYKFNANDVLIPLVGLVHDIGKIECYEVTNNGTPVEKRSKHDWRGKFVLTGLDEFWKLPPLDQETLLDVVGYYHHPWEIPLSVSDRARSLIEIVMEADIEAGKFEAQYPRMATKDDILEMVQRMLIARGEKPSKAVLQDESLPYAENLNGHALSLHQSRLLYFFEEMMFDKDAVNGGDIDKRIGFRIGDTLYFNEEAVRLRLGETLAAKRLIDLKKSDGQKVLTTRLLEVMEMRGSLVREVDGLEYGSSRAIFKVVTRKPNGKSYRELAWTSVFMIDSTKYPSHLTTKIEDSDMDIVSITPVFSRGSARNKTTSLVVSKTPSIANESPENHVAETESIELSHGDDEASGISVVVKKSSDKKDQVEDDVLSSFDPSSQKDGGYDDSIGSSDLANQQVTMSNEEIDQALNEHEGMSVARMAFEAGSETTARSLQETIQAGMAIPDVLKPKEKTKREKLKDNKLAAMASTPVNSGLWWETNNGADGVDRIIDNMKVTREESKDIKLNGVDYTFFDLEFILATNEIPSVGRDKFIKIMRGIDKFVVSKGKNKPDQLYIGVKTSLLEMV